MSVGLKINITGLKEYGPSKGEEGLYNYCFWRKNWIVSDSQSHTDNHETHYDSRNYYLIGARKNEVNVRFQGVLCV